MDDTPSGSRRRLLGSLATAGTVLAAGCQVWDQHGAVDVVAHDAGEEPLRVTVTITPVGAESPHTDRAMALAPGEVVDRVNDGKLPANDDYGVVVAVEDGPAETYEWTDVDLGRAPLWVVVDGSENVRFLQQVG